MDKTTRLITLAVFTAGLLGVTGLPADDDDARRLAETRLTLVEAIQIAETHQTGQAFEANLDDDSFNPEYEVEVFANGRIYEVTVDGVSGEVLRVKESRDD